VNEEPVELLRAAREKAEKLLAGLIAQGEDLDRQPRDIRIDPAKLAEGREAFAGAIASARRTLEAIDEALKLT
jgi:hypothetical protein